jgi:dihydroorotate dehydrogenase
MLNDTKILISPPFGNYYNPSWATAVVGTYTAQPRPGLIMQVLKTVRPIHGGWVNSIGFRNPGILYVEYPINKIISVAGFYENDWLRIHSFIPAECSVEVNVGCPNVQDYSISKNLMEMYIEKFANVILKIPPSWVWLNRVQQFIEEGLDLKYVHMSNTLPSLEGGISGQQLKAVNLPLVELMKINKPDLKIIAGGGIYGIADLREYRDAGADYFSLATGLLKPWKLWGLENL